MTKGGLLFMAAAVVIAIAVGAWNAFRLAEPGEPPPAIVVAAPGTPRAAPVAAAPPQPETLQPVIAQGRRELGDSVFAVRDGSDVTVNFDTEMLRTRFDWKFEGVVRATLPLVYGEVVRSVLDSIPAGTLANKGDLLTQLPEVGIPLKVGEHTLRVYPVVRPGRDGPLVVGYRVAAGPSGQGRTPGRRLPRGSGSLARLAFTAPTATTHANYAKCREWVSERLIRKPRITGRMS